MEHLTGKNSLNPALRNGGVCAGSSPADIISLSHFEYRATSQSPVNFQLLLFLDPHIQKVPFKSPFTKRGVNCSVCLCVCVSFAIDWRPAQRLLIYLKTAALVCHLEVEDGYPNSGRARLLSVHRSGKPVDTSGLKVTDPTYQTSALVQAEISQ